MKMRCLGKKGPWVSALGLGCMGMSIAYGKAEDRNEAESIKVIQYAIDELGVNFIDTADMYGEGHNEELISKAIQHRRERIVLATKTGFVRAGQDYQYKIDGSPKHIRAACDASLKRLNVEYIDLYYLHRADVNTPIEESVDALASLVTAGKIKYIGLSEVSAKTLQRAAKVHPITALQTEYSLWQRKPEKEILSTCRALGIGFVPYSPLGRGFLSGKISSINELAQDDFRRVLPKFQLENISVNKRIVDAINLFAKEKNCTPAQFALAWLLAQGEDVVPIPGTKKIHYLEENVKAVEIKLTPTELQQFNSLVPESVGLQYPKELDLEI